MVGADGWCSMNTSLQLIYACTIGVITGNSIIYCIRRLRGRQHATGDAMPLATPPGRQKAAERPSWGIATFYAEDLTVIGAQLIQMIGDEVTNPALKSPPETVYVSMGSPGMVGEIGPDGKLWAITHEIKVGE